MQSFQLTYKKFGGAAILIEWPNRIDAEILDNIRVFTEHIEKSKIKGVLDYNFVYSSLLISYDPDVISCNALISKLKTIYKEERSITEMNKKTWYIPVCYDEEFGIDLASMADTKKMDVLEIIDLHTSNFYTVYGIGFSPGFLYLGGLPEELHISRKSVPRLNVPSGAVAIGGNQTGIYPQDSPGGWHIIGKTPIPLFDVNKTQPCFSTAGDEIKFYAISKPEFDVKKVEVKAGLFNFDKPL